MKNWFDRIRKFFEEVREEIFKCTRPSSQELKESTVVVVITMAILGGFILSSDVVISRTLGWIMTH